MKKQTFGNIGDKVTSDENIKLTIVNNIVKFGKILVKLAPEYASERGHFSILVSNLKPRKAPYTYSFKIKSDLDQIDVERIIEDLSADKPIARLNATDNNKGISSTSVIILPRVLKKAELLNIPIPSILNRYDDVTRAIFEIDDATPFSEVVDWVSLVQKADFKEHRVDLDVKITLVQSR